MKMHFTLVLGTHHTHIPACKAQLGSLHVHWAGREENQDASPAKRTEILFCLFGEINQRNAINTKGSTAGAEQEGVGGLVSGWMITQFRNRDLVQSTLGCQRSGAATDVALVVPPAEEMGTALARVSLVPPLPS